MTVLQQQVLHYEENLEDILHGGGDFSPIESKLLEVAEQCWRQVLHTAPRDHQHYLADALWRQLLRDL